MMIWCECLCLLIAVKKKSFHLLLLLFLWKYWNVCMCVNVEKEKIAYVNWKRKKWQLKYNSLNFHARWPNQLPYYFVLNKYLNFRSFFMWNYFMLFSRSKISSLFFQKQSKLAKFGSQFSTISYISKNGRCKMENRMKTISIKICVLISEMSTNPNDKPHWRRSVRE